MSQSPPSAVDATRRTRLANERTFLAWWRTALAVQGLAVATGKIVPEVTTGPDWPYVVVGTLFAVLGASLALTGWWRFATVEHNLSGGEAASMPGWLAAVLGGMLGLLGLAVAVLVVAS
jgi:inner membrane protein YidH